MLTPKASFQVKDAHLLTSAREELDDIIRYGSKELFADENDEAGKLRQIHYDDAAIDRLLNRDQVVDEDAVVDDEEEDSFLKAFKGQRELFIVPEAARRPRSASPSCMSSVRQIWTSRGAGLSRRTPGEWCWSPRNVANFEYIEEAEATPEEDISTPPLENKATVLNSERATYWEELLRDRYEMHKVEEFNGMGKGKRSRKQMVSVEDDDLAGLEEVTSDGEDDNYEADSDGETALPGAPVVRRPYRKRARGDSSVPLPLMEGEGKSFRVLGFNQSQRAAFVKILMRFGVGDYDWAEFTPRLKQKTYEEIRDYGTLFLSHIAEDITESPSFTDGVPKEGLRIPDVLVRIAVLLLIRDKGRPETASLPPRGTGKVKAFLEERNSPLFSMDIVSWFPGLKGGRVWKEDHDLLLLQAVLKHGYGRWQAIIDDKELRIQEVVCKELNLPSISLPVPGATQPQVPPAPGASQPLPTSGVSQAQVSAPGVHQAPNGVNTANAGTTGNQVKAADETNHEHSHGTSDPSNRTQLYQDSSLLYHLREMQRRQVEFIRKRVMLLENAINAEYQREVVGYPGKEMECDTKIVDEPSRNVEAAGTEMIDNFPKLIAISPQGISDVACDGEADRLSVAQLYNKMCKVLSDNGEDSFNAVASQPANVAIKKDLLPLESFFQEMKRVLSSAHQKPQEDWKPEGVKPSPVPSFLGDVRLHSAEERHDNFPTGTESESQRERDCRIFHSVGSLLTFSWILLPLGIPCESSSASDWKIDLFGHVARMLEAQLDEQMHLYRRFVSNKTGNANDNDLESNIDQLLKQLQQVNSQMQAWVSSGGSEIFSHTLTRHQEILQDLFQDVVTSLIVLLRTVENSRQEFNRLRSSYRAKKEHASLLEDFREFDRTRLDLEDGSGSHDQALLNERAALHRSTGQMDGVISQAQETIKTLMFQRSTFGGINSKLSNVISRLPTYVIPPSVLKGLLGIGTWEQQHGIPVLVPDRMPNPFCINASRKTMPKFSPQLLTMVETLPSGWAPVNHILSAIKKKKSMDTVILSLVASVCMFLILVYWMTK
ncbi:Golgi SNAP receptor complex member 1-1 [Capsicum annuum]|nr:Golgi SNAP receptor complex member 1-1 [Capsicum annuum]